MYRSKLTTNNKTLPALRADLAQFLADHQKIHCAALRRPVFFDELPDAIIRRKATAKKRLQCFAVAIDILKRSKKCTPNPKNKQEFEVSGYDCNDQLVKIHIRNQQVRGDHKLQFISCF